MKKLLIILFFALGFLTTANPVQAHFLATDKNIGAVLHVDPNDSPIAGEQASFFFELKDKQNKLTPKKCDCTFEIDENGQAIYSQPLFQSNKKPSLSNASVFYTFPKIDVYTIKIIGKPHTSGEFQSFILSWNFRVDQQTNEQSVLGTHTSFFSEHAVHFVIGGGILIAFLIYVFRPKREKNKKPKKGGEKKDDEEDFRDMY